MLNTMIKICICILLISLTLPSCKSGTEKAKSAPTASANIPPAIPSDVLINVYENCDFIDFIFSSLPFSISQENKASIQQTLTYIVPSQPQEIKEDCPYFAQQIFQINGEIVLDAKLFFQQGCVYYLFYENGKAVYSASLNENGIKFYNNVIEQAQNTSGNG